MFIHSREEQPTLNTAILALEDGTVFEGRSFGAPTERSGEVVFNTSITGYQEIFTDPSYAGQIVVLTNPQIGNYGTNVDDNEAAKPLHRRLGGPRVFRRSPATGARTQKPTTSWPQHGIPVISDIDTRALVRHLRTRGVMRGVLSADRARSAGDWSRRRAASRPWRGSIWPRGLHRRSATSGPKPSSRARHPS